MKSLLQTILAVLTMGLVAEANPAADRNFKKGLAMHNARSCGALSEHETSGWWYSWGAKSGFDNSFCDDPVSAEADARGSGMEFIPMFWSSVPDFDSANSRMVDDEIHSNLEQTEYILTFNEPELEGQANISPTEAAEIWADIEAIAAAYNVEIVAPCTTSGHGVAWYDEWSTACNSLYGRECEYEYTCIHMYYQPYTADTSETCDSSDHDWACIQPGSEQGPIRAEKKIEEWVANWGKPIWVTEYACAPWGSDNGCSPQEQIDIMNQLTPFLEESPDVFRYAWFGLYGGEGEGGGVGEREGLDKWDGNGLTENVWPGKQGVGCEDKEWIAAFGTDASWKIQTKQECMAKADASDECAKPLILSMDDDNCYCAPPGSECVLEETWSAMRTWYETGDRDSGAKTAIGELYEKFGQAPLPTDPPEPELPATCYDYSDILPLDIDWKCTGGRSIFLEIRAKYMEDRDAPGAERCPGGLSAEIKALTETSTTDEAHDVFDAMCEEHMKDWDTPYSRVGPPSVCYDYTDVLELGAGECTDRKLFLHVREKFMEQRKAEGAKSCDGGLGREIMALTGTLTTDDAHQAFHDLCADALQAASDEVDTFSWGQLESDGGVDLEKFFDGAGFLNDETGNFQQEENDFLKRGGYDKFIYIGDDPRLNDHYKTTEASYAGGLAINEIYTTNLRSKFLSAPATTGFQDGSCPTSNAAVCCWHRDRQYFDKNGNCGHTDCADQNPGDNTDLCWTENNGEVFPYPGDETENDLHCHGLAWAQDDLSPGDINAKAKWNNLFFVSLYDHLYQRGYADSITDDEDIAGQQAMCGCVEDMNPVARADCTEAAPSVSYTASQEEIGGPFTVRFVPGTFAMKFQACEGYDYVEGFTPEDYAEFGDEDLDDSNNDLAAFVFRQYLEGKLNESHVNTIEKTLIGYRDPSVNDGDEEREIACQAAFEARYPELEWEEREIVA